MSGDEVIESFNNAWRALTKQYRNYPDQSVQIAMNFLGRMIGEVKSQHEKAKRERESIDNPSQITADEWLQVLSEIIVEDR